MWSTLRTETLGVVRFVGLNSMNNFGMADVRAARALRDPAAPVWSPWRTWPPIGSASRSRCPWASPIRASAGSS